MSNKRTLEDAKLEDNKNNNSSSSSISNPQKKRKLNSEDAEGTPSSSSLSTVPLTSVSKSPSSPKDEPNTNKDDDDNGKKPTTSTESNSGNNSNAENENNANKESKKDDKNDNGAKSEDEKKDKNDTTDDNNGTKWTFKASDFTFGDNAWVKQTSNASNLSNNENEKEVVNDDNTTSSFKEYQGLGFEAVLKQGDDKKDDKEKKDDNEKDKISGWGSGWSNSNPDGTFKLNFDWGSFGDTNIDLNPSSGIGYGTEAPVYDPNNFETEEPEAVLTGQIDTGDKSDETVFSLKCKVYTLENNKYNEKGIGIVKINQYKLENESKHRARMLCRREQVLSTLINAPILKEMKFTKVSTSYIRFGVIEQVTDDDKNDDENSKIEKKEEKETNNDDKDKNEDNDNKTKKEEDNDIKTQIVTYLIKPIGDKSQIDIMLTKINELQEKLN